METFISRKIIVIAKNGKPTAITRNVVRKNQQNLYYVTYNGISLEVYCTGEIKDTSSIWVSHSVADIQVPEAMERNVIDGIHLLNTYISKWHTLIRLSQLNMSQTSLCILGQLYGDYARGIEQLDINPDDSSDYGFSASDYSYAALQLAWIRKILEIRSREFEHVRG